MLRNKDVCKKYDLSSVRLVYSGAAPLGDETVQQVKDLYPKWTVAQAYGKPLTTRPPTVRKLTRKGMTETSVVVCSPSEHDIYPRASGSILPGVKAKLIDTDGNEVTEHEKPGELYLQGPMVVLGYLHNQKATAETFVYHSDGRWIRTGDEALFAVSPKGNEQVVIVDRIKELIKVKVHQRSRASQGKAG